ncbi:hypothetical protein TRAPUB_3370 [Trametes pubescens]|uniref:Uncharacterized protein n=1 Tax=Trametes pubescens TaxID=154538 RepID=A0A1M2VDQ4_TRAPU|nr:hypothetical protein TRAPUB_3370 [Trametes pubescens]
METRKSLDGHLESYRLKIVWTFSAGLDAMDVDQREVGFEDLDLVAYSSLPSLQTPQGMPLKAVYQEGVVGIRYQHPRIAPPGTTPVVFDSPHSASAFIESIRFICPCKANAPPPPRVAQRASVAQTGYTAPQNSQMPAMAAPSPARPTPRPTVKQAMSIAPEDDPAPGIRVPNWEVPPVPHYYAQAPQAQPVSVSPAPSSASGAVSARDDYAYAYGSSRPSSAVAHHSSSSSGPSSSVSVTAAAAAPAPARVQAPSPVSASAPAQAKSASGSAARPPQIKPSATMLAHSGSSDSLPSSSFPYSSSSPPPMARLRPSSPDLMPPPPVPAIVSRISTPSPAATQAAASATVPAPASVPVAPVAAPSTTISAPLKVLVEPSIASSSAGPAPAADIAASLRDSAGLYALPKDELERLVAEVIREEGFADLVRSFLP